jgi:hypothetical protein
MADLRKKLLLKVRHKAKFQGIGLTRNSFTRPQEGARIVYCNWFWVALISFWRRLVMYYKLLSLTSSCTSDPGAN